MSQSPIIRFNSNGPDATGLQFLGNLESENVLAGAPVETGHVYFSDPGGEMSAGVWECTPCTSEVVSQPLHEFCLILSGTAVITDGDGNEQTFKVGDSFLIPMGTHCTWHMPETLRKYFVLFGNSASQAEAETEAAE